MSTSLVLLLLVFVCLSILPWGDCHAILTYPTARSGQAVAPGIKIASLPVPAGVTCGGTAAADPGPQAVVATFNAGQTVTVQWQLTIDHVSAPGVSVALQYSSADTFSNNLMASGVDVHLLQTNITLPVTKTSSTAVLQWIWASNADGGYYIACSDIAILAAGTPVGTTTTAAPGGSTTPKSEAFAIRYSVGVLAMLLASLVAAFLYH